MNEILNTEIQYTINNFHGLYNKTFQIENIIIGVYFLYDNNENIIYIGKSKNIKNRLKTHFKENNSKYLSLKDKFTHNMKKDETLFFAYTEIPIEYYSVVEIFLINKYSPKYNDPSLIDVELFSKKELCDLYDSLC